MSEYIKYFDNLDQAEGYEIREVPFSGYIKEPHLALFSKFGGTIIQGEVSYDRYLFYTTNNQEVAQPTSYNFGANLVDNVYINGQGMIVFDGDLMSIGDHAFLNCHSLTSVTIPNSATSIGDYAFALCSSLTSITIPNSVTSIEDYAFHGCSSLTSATIPNSVTSIGYGAFYECSSLTSVTIPNSVTSIGNGAFSGCTSLTSITIPNSVTSIEDYAFCECSSLTSVTIPNSVTSIGAAAFRDCSSLTSVTCKAVTPPTLASDNYLSNVTAVYVPVESVDLYKTATNWSYYSNVIQPIQ